MTAQVVTPQSDAQFPRLAARYTGRVLSALLVGFVAFDALIKLTGLIPVREAMRPLGYPDDLSAPVAALEIVGLTLYAARRTCRLGAVALSALVAGAILSHAAAGELLPSHILLGAYVALLAWGGVYLRAAGRGRWQ